MNRLITLGISALAASAAPASAEWTAANPAVSESAKHPLVAGALAAAGRVDDAIVARSIDDFIGAFAADAVVNSPANIVTSRAQAEMGFHAGAINYHSLERSIEHAAPRGDNEVVLMGEEVVTPRDGARYAGKTVRRRFTDLWRLEDGEWKLSLRQATIIAVE